MKKDCHVEPIRKTPNLEEIQNINEVFLTVWGMGCPNCAARVRNSLVSLQGVVEAQVDHQAGVAKVTYNPTLVSMQELADAVFRAGGDGRHEYRAVLTPVNFEETSN
ncbi:MAG: hypothetical protein A2X25_11835 [Chloroflexi bacterium GWB2_49_20]|nr:MAG: hypothetical protein A2X25_11835 [Chloroflexi bacterium GWB2_49_20]OGN77695.1 MAG: hypothetical protein A2X26_10105 [Chloroflexi bacterium GWC2_49_37]OGN86470.1 MAG: hypothetical protein A2X27_06260 [Chloroflexi bacterium GWD2_49_16]HBG74716.1 hypothetical protein [Anaerolineae bacterium]